MISILKLFENIETVRNNYNNQMTANDQSPDEQDNRADLIRQVSNGDGNLVSKNYGDAINDDSVYNSEDVKDETKSAMQSDENIVSDPDEDQVQSQYTKHDINNRQLAAMSTGIASSAIRQ